MVYLIMWFLEDKPKYVTSFGTDKFTQGTSFTKKNCGHTTYTFVSRNGLRLTTYGAYFSL